MNLNRIRNQVFFDAAPETSVALNSQGGFNQRKAAQLIEDIEYNGYVNDVINIINEEGEEGNSSKKFDVDLGVFYRNKERDFSSEFVGVTESNSVDRFSTRTNSLDNLNDILNVQNFANGSLQVVRLSSNSNGETKDI